MLAEKHIRVKYSINPRGNDWSNDEDKFGQKMLEKFGWEKGKGLGLQEDGRREHVRVSKKSDTKGLGFKKVFGDNLINQQDDFNSLLNSLGETHTSVSHAADDDVSKLAEKSCSAKKRVHYHKHVKGKDLSGWTTEDMDCIFGRRKIKMKKPETELVSSSLSSKVVVLDAAANVAVHSESAGKQVLDEKQGVLTINTGKSVSEYFAMKMTELMKGGHSRVTDTEPAQRESLITELDCTTEGDYCPEQATKDKSDCTMDVDHCLEEAVKRQSKKKKKKKKRVKDEEFVEEKRCELTTDVDCEHNELVNNYNKEATETTSESLKVQRKKKKDDKKCKETEFDVGCGDENDISYEEIVCTTSCEAKSKKSKKKKKKVQDCEVVDSENAFHNYLEQSMTLLNSGEQSTVLNLEDTGKDAETRDEEFYTKRKKKKKKRSREEMDNFSKEDSLSVGVSDKNPTEECTAPKSRKDKDQLEKECNVLHESVNEEKSSKFPDNTIYSHCTFGNFENTKGSQQETSMEPMYRKDIKHNTEALQSALETFQVLGANVLDIIGYSS